MNEYTLNNLPLDHKLRTTSLYELQAEYQIKDSKTWHSINVLGGIKKSITFNQLGEVWTKWDKWRVIIDDPD